MKLAKASIALCVIVFLVVQGEAAHALKKHQDQPTLEQYGPVQVSVTWTPEGDGDLIVRTPSGKVISYSNSGPSVYTDNGRLERDVRSGSGPETVYWDDAAPAGTYLVCFRTAALGPSEENPVRVQATAFSPDGTRDTLTKEFTESSSIDCRPSSSGFVGAFVYNPRETDAPRRTYAQPPAHEEEVPIIIEDDFIPHHWDPEPEPIPEPMPEPVPIIDETPIEYGEPVSLADVPRLGPLQFSATWDRLGDCDLFVNTPSGKLITYTNRGPSENTDYGQLHEDIQSGVGPETIYWADASAAPAGTYDICLRANLRDLESNPVTVHLAIFNGDSVETMAQTIATHTGAMECSPSSAGYIGSYTL